MYVLIIAFMILGCSKTNKIPPTGYLISITTDSTNRGFIPINNNGFDGRQMIMGSGTEEKEVQLYIVDADKVNTEKLEKQLQLIPGFIKVSFAHFNHSISPSESKAVRKIFTELNYDLRNLDDDKLSLFLNSILKGEYKYSLDFDNKRNENGLTIARLRLTQDIIDEYKNDPPPKIISSKKLNGTEVEIAEYVLEEIHVEPPPPPPQQKFAEMTDAQIKQWYLKSAHPNIMDVDVARTPKEIIITEKYPDGSSATVHYKIN